ncbi:SNO glutamine amidotransferase [Staphylothermus marinus F1]|uniref:Pyridoxal 5'-phosphate synthase subunit PdxT n=1 Tax=Staphylothermus marinus (strain ATCC 43588 / DSM 3639 / JCM 9404 / F1) TaxID=399550 RepID=PDXT_STAMF|nr:pyridoxal 5'-phosphate synthase glutaminase subunit PdxT [Staphylothermus marinus]A3DM32.1 RecName: Full=Pyridoxal 5'-phosphate synthase subunit PdxT; AltName: Full=Pdx2; AltName: Full=Pyridoxal 5'-phosphate synthase glutaminase subunit [Staphylothermus marinus F1]ABN69692.1 SNO glutamine amidotransferase [Staphylothermus marinus F1]
MRIGVLGFQGGVYEHVYMLKKSFHELGINGKVLIVKKPQQLHDLDGIIIPGGESTTISILARKTNVLELLREKIVEGLPVMGVCAGAIMLAKEVVDQVVGETKQPLLGVMDIAVTRNYFGRQRESFELDIVLDELDDKPFRAVFIRAPAITKYWGATKPIGIINYNGEKVVVAARENNKLALSFHPELTSDTRIHRYFIEKIIKK